MLSPVFKVINGAEDSPLAFERILEALPKERFGAVGTKKCPQRFVAVSYPPQLPRIRQRLERGMRRIKGEDEPCRASVAIPHLVRVRLLAKTKHCKLIRSRD